MECDVSAALSDQVNWLHAHQTIQNAIRTWPTAPQVAWPWSSSTILVIENTNTRSKNSSTKLTR